VSLFAKNLSIVDCIAIDPVTGEHGVPNKVCTKKTPEGQPVEYRLNHCGDRAGMECGTKTPGAFRIVMAGPSYAFGWGIPRQQTFAALLPAELSRLTGRTVELYNTSQIGEGGVPRSIDLRFNDVLAEHPDAILWVLDPWGIDKADRTLRAWEEHSPLRIVGQMVKQALKGKPSFKEMPTLQTSVQDKWLTWNPGVILMEHYLFQSQSEYVRQSLVKGPESGFLKAEPDAYWQYRLKKFDAYAADIEGRAKAAGVPIVVVLVPNRAQVAMISMSDWPSGYDPYALGKQLRAIVTSHGGTYIDILQDFRAIPNAEKHYYPTDDHPDPSAHAMIADMLAKELTGGAVPALRAAPMTQPAGQRR